MRYDSSKRRGQESADPIGHGGLVMTMFARLRSAIPIGVAMVIAVTHSAAAQSSNLTGTWEGTQTCKGSGFSAVKLRTAELHAQMKITQSPTAPDELNVQIGARSYNGRLMLTPPRPGSGVQEGQVTLIQCDSTPALSDYSEMVFLKVVLKVAPQTGKLAGISVFRDPAANTKAAFAVGTCKWSYARTDTQDPGMSGCP